MATTHVSTTPAGQEPPSVTSPALPPVTESPTPVENEQVRTGLGVASFEFASVPYTIIKADGVWSVRLRHADVPVASVGELNKLTFTHPALMACRIEWHEDQVTLHTDVDAGWITFDELARRPRTDKLRAMINVAETAALVDMGYGVVLEPENLLFDRNLRPKLAYRGIAGLMPPAGMDQAMFLRQYQALILALFDKRATFSSVFEGAMTLKHASDFDKTVTTAGSPAALATYLTSLFDEQAETDDGRLVRVSRRRHQVFKYLTIWLAVKLCPLAWCMAR